MFLLKIILLPFALLAAVFLAMITHIGAVTVHHQAAWTRAEATVARAEMLCEVTYQPADAVLRQVAGRGPCDAMEDVALPDGGTTPRIWRGLYGTLVYEADGAAQTWEGKLADAGVYEVAAGDRLVLYYDPSAPQNVDTAQAKGWMGGLLLFAATAGFVGFYGWLVWPRRRGEPPRGNLPPSPRAIVPPAPAGLRDRNRRPFGKA